MHTLRSRLLLSHLVPLIVVMPLLGLLLIYVLETRIFTGVVGDELTRQTHLVALMAQRQPEIWQSPQAAQRFVDEVWAAETRPDSTVTLFNAEGRLLATRQGDNAPLAPPATVPLSIRRVHAGEFFHSTHSGRQNGAAIITAWGPVTDPQAGGATLGAVRITRPLQRIADDIFALRYWIAAALGIATLTGALLSSILADNLSRPLDYVTGAIARLGTGRELTPLPESGPAEIRSLLNTFNKLVERLRRLETGRRQLLANLIHELGRPLGSVTAAVQALQRGAVDDPAFRNDLLAGVAGEVQRLDRLVENLEQLADRVVGTFELKREAVPLRKWLTALVSTWQVTAEAKPLTLTTDFPTLLPLIEADPDRLGQVLGNLLSNAIRYTPPGGTIQVRAGFDNLEAWVAVQDSGPGIGTDEQAKIFDPFYRSSQHTRFPQGMGLGLTIAQDIAGAHGGRITVQSTEGEGSTFTLFVPIRATLESP